jgi:type II secretory pathway pseudopilin PulG
MPEPVALLIGIVGALILIAIPVVVRMRRLRVRKAEVRAARALSEASDRSDRAAREQKWAKEWAEQQAASDTEDKFYADRAARRRPRVAAAARKSRWGSASSPTRRTHMCA